MTVQRDNSKTELIYWIKFRSTPKPVKLIFDDMNDMNYSLNKYYTNPNYGEVEWMIKFVAFSMRAQLEGV